MQRLVLGSLVLIGITSCRSEPRDIRTLTEANGRYLNTASGKPHSGPFIEYFSDKPEIRRIGQIKKGLLHGTVISFYAHESLRAHDTASVASYKLGLLDGRFTSWRDDACVKSTREYSKAIDTTEFVAEWEHVVSCVQAVGLGSRIRYPDSTLTLTFRVLYEQPELEDGPRPYERMSSMEVSGPNKQIGLQGQFLYGYPVGYWTFNSIQNHSWVEFVLIFNNLIYESNTRWGRLDFTRNKPHGIASSIMDLMDIAVSDGEPITKVLGQSIYPQSLYGEWMTAWADTTRSAREKTRERLREQMAVQFGVASDSSVSVVNFLMKVGDEYEFVSEVARQRTTEPLLPPIKFSWGTETSRDIFHCIPAGRNLRKWKSKGQEILDSLPLNPALEDCELNGNLYDKGFSGTQLRKGERHWLPVQLTFLRD